MARLERFAVLEGDFDPDAGVEPDFVGPGIEVCEVLREVLNSLGARTGEIGLRDAYGQEFDATMGKERYWFLVQYPGHWLLTCEHALPLFAGLFRKQSNFLPALERLDQALRKDGRIRDIRWFSRAEYEQRETEIGQRERRERQARHT